MLAQLSFTWKPNCTWDPNPGDETTYTVHLGGEAKGTCMASESQGDLLKNKTVLSTTFLNSQLVGDWEELRKSLKR